MSEIETLRENKMKFDVIAMNPPYQGDVKEANESKGRGSRNALWVKFVKLALDKLKPDGYLAAVHPPKWRKPDDSLYKMLCDKNIIHLEMYDNKSGKRVFGAQVDYDWYVLQNSKYGGATLVKDILGEKISIDLRGLFFLPNCYFDKVSKLIAKDTEEKCKILYSYSLYESRQSWMKMEKSKIFCHPCVYSTPKSGARFAYSSKKGEFFDTPKILIGHSGVIGDAVVDYKGEYGITQHALGIVISSEEEGQNIKKAVESKAFNDLLLTAMRWSPSMLEWKLFGYLRKDFWKDFI